MLTIYQQCNICLILLCFEHLFLAIRWMFTKIHCCPTVVLQPIRQVQALSLLVSISITNSSNEDAILAYCQIIQALCLLGAVAEAESLLTQAHSLMGEARVDGEDTTAMDVAIMITECYVLLSSHKVCNCCFLYQSVLFSKLGDSFLVSILVILCHFFCIFTNIQNILYFCRSQSLKLFSGKFCRSIVINAGPGRRTSGMAPSNTSRPCIYSSPNQSDPRMRPYIVTSSQMTFHPWSYGQRP